MQRKNCKPLKQLLHHLESQLRIINTLGYQTIYTEQSGEIVMLSGPWVEDLWLFDEEW